eukprot:TRINITY_DN17027_c0_g1_i1.p1 TRINITY_DN17027_c0_g1~~TRINITY_DN17027_c0_g1_i1.p1  ORF type:complete len:165 (-),score=51.38 TRINITY_DN17027_c0_g1_i1:92-559(-)
MAVHKVLVAALLLVAVAVAQTCDSQSNGNCKYSDSTARSKVNSAGISVSSSGGCSNRNDASCTSLDQVNCNTVADVITLHSASGCAVTITGGTETGHASGTFSHWNGYKLDLSMTSCLTNYIEKSFYKQDDTHWISAAGNIYYYESNHWDVCYCS